MTSIKQSSRTLKMFRILSELGHQDDAHREYLKEECGQLDLMNAWADFLDAISKGRRSVNPDDLMVNYLLGISQYDPLCPRTIAYDPDGITESNYTPSTIVFDDETEAIVHPRALVAVDVVKPSSWRDSTGVLQNVSVGKNSLPVEALRPGMIMSRRGSDAKIFMIIPARVSPNPKDYKATSRWKSERVDSVSRQYAEFENQEAAEKFAKDLAKKDFASFNEQRGDLWVAGFIGAHSNTFREVMSDDHFEDSQGITLVPRIGRHHWINTNEFPDIDIDYPPDCLSKIIPFAEKMFGQDKVVGVATYQRFGMKSSFKDVCRVHGIPLIDVMRVADAIPDEVQKLRRSDKDFDKQWQGFLDETPEIQEFLNVPGDQGVLHHKIFEVMKGLHGKARTFSQHASAMIISKETLDGAVPMVARKGVRLASWAEGQDRTDLSKYGQVKFDRLGLQTLCDRNECVEMLYRRGKLDRSIGLFRRPRPDWVNDPEDDWMFADWTEEDYLEDVDVLLAAAEGRTIGCFQFESPGIREMLRQIGPTYFEELVAANAMYRPGVLKAKIDGIDGGDKAFIARKKGQVQYIIPEPLKPYLSKTYGLLVYQEQVMKVLEIAGGIPATECEIARKAISKKKVEVLNKYRELFKRIAPKTVGWSEDEAAKYFDENIVVWSGYGFNRSHSLAYALIAAQTLYLKTHYPIEFFCSFMSSVGKTKNEHDRMRSFIGDAANHGVKVLGADINDSKINFTIARDPKDPSKEIIRYGLAHVKKVGKMADEIVAAQPYRSFGDFLKRGVRKKDVVLNLIHAGAFDRFCRNHAALVEFFESWRQVAKKGIGPQRYNDFLKAAGIPKNEVKKELEAFKAECIALLTPEIDEDGPEEDTQDAAAIVERQSEDVPLLDLVPEEIATKNSEQESKSPAVVKAKPMDTDIFKRWVRDRWHERLDDSTYSLAIEESNRDLIPPDLDETIPDMAPAVRMMNATEAYGSMASFLNPINHVTVPIMWIANYGKPLPEEAPKIDDEDGGKSIKSLGEVVGGGGPGFRRLQSNIDGFVMKVDRRTSKKEGASGRPFWRITIDDGFDRTMITAWADVWQGAGWRGESIAIDEQGCRVIVGTNDSGMPIYKKERVHAPKDIVKENKLVRFRVKNKSRWGFTLDDAESGSPVSLLPTTDEWPNDMS